MIKLFLRYFAEFFYLLFCALPFLMRKKIIKFLVFKNNIEKKPGNFIHFDNKNLKKKIIIFDVGSYDGRSIDNFLKNHTNVVVHSFEPNPELYMQLKKKYKDNKNVIINQKALSNNSKHKDFYINSFSETSSLNMLNSRRSRRDKNYTKKIIKVQCITLDQYSKKNKIKKINLIKLDTQTNENLILKGAKRLLNNRLIDYVKLELIFENYYKKKIQFFDIEKNFINYNYQLINLEDLKYSSNSKILQLDAIYKFN